MGNKVVVGLAMSVLLGTGCFSPPQEALDRLAEAKAGGAELDQAIEGLEERFLANQANVMLWQELARRHRTVSEIACNNHTEHLEAMVKHMERQTEKMKQIRRRRVAQAKADSVASRAAPASHRSQARN